MIFPASLFGLLKVTISSGQNRDLLDSSLSDLPGMEYGARLEAKDFYETRVQGSL